VNAFPRWLDCAANAGRTAQGVAGLPVPGGYRLIFEDSGMPKPKVDIGSKYEGIPFDRPALRRLPRGWVLEETRKTPLFWRAYFVAEALLLAALVVTLAYSIGNALGRTL
jgi:hypothetical protein